MVASLLGLRASISNPQNGTDTSFAHAERVGGDLALVHAADAGDCRYLGHRAALWSSSALRRWYVVVDAMLVNGRRVQRSVHATGGKRKDESDPHRQGIEFNQMALLGSDHLEIDPSLVRLCPEVLKPHLAIREAPRF